MDKPTVGSLFAGIGGFDLGFERAGFEIEWQVEIDPYCRKVLERHFPNAKRFNDVRECGAHNLEPVDVLCGGFPCQDISNAGKRAGIDGERSGLWSEYARIIRELRPRFVVVENVAALLGRGLGRVLRDLAEIGYDAEWEIISAADVGAPHLRERVWIVAYPGGLCAESQREAGNMVGAARTGKVDGTERQRDGNAAVDSGADVADSEGFVERSGFCTDEPSRQRWRRSGDGGCEVADAARILEGWQEQQPQRERIGESGESVAGGSAIESGLEGFAGDSANRPGWTQPNGSTGAAGVCGEVSDTFHNGPYRAQADEAEPRSYWAHDWIPERNRQWLVEPDVGRVAHGVPARVDRLKALGNAVVPQIPELIARRLLEILWLDLESPVTPEEMPVLLD